MWANRRAIIVTCLFGVFVIAAPSQEVSSPEKSTVSNVSPIATEPSQQASVIPNWHPSPPTVKFENGLLTIIAENSTLQEVLEAVHQKTGAKVEAPFLDPSKISVQLGPGDPAEILAKLLYGIHFNYIILGTTSELQPLERVIITPRSEMSMASNYRPPKPTVPAPEVLATTEPEAAPADASGTAAEVPVEQAKKDADSDADPNADKDKDKDKDKDADKVADKQETPAADDKTAADVKAAEAAMAAAGTGAAALPEDPSAAERIANLPEGINPALASLYPSLFGGGQSGSSSGNGSVAAPGSLPFGANGQPLTQGSLPQAYNPVPIQLNSAGIPILPSNIPPEMWNLYPANLLDLIRNSSGSQAYTQPVTPLIPGSSGNGQGVLWDQGLKPPHH